MASPDEHERVGIDELRDALIASLQGALRRAEMVNELPLWRDVQAYPHPLELLEQLDELARVASQGRDQVVRLARAQGVSWEHIGATVGMSRQSAHERWRRLDHVRSRRDVLDA